MENDELTREEDKARHVLRAFGVFAGTQDASGGGNDGVPWAWSGGGTGITIEQAFHLSKKEFRN